MNPAWCISTARLELRPVIWSDLPEMQALKADPLAFALMLGGVRTKAKVVLELAEEIRAWGAHGFGVWTVRRRDGGFLGMTALEARPDGRGVALRFALWPRVRGSGLAREAAGAALRYAHAQAKLGRVIAVARADNFASRTVLGAIGMRECDRFCRAGIPMLVYESIRSP
jgi:RimJ/RimL family protein N-acetyltransferase